MPPRYHNGGIQIHHGDCRDVLPTLDAASVNCCVTSPPYWGLRDYGVEGQMGLEQTPTEYVEALVDVFREVRRVLRDDGTLWLNLGDSYAGSGGGHKEISLSSRLSGGGKLQYLANCVDPDRAVNKSSGIGLKPKDLVGIPWRVAFALQADGWYLRSDIIWHKPNPMPESVTDRPTKSHEYIFLMSKSKQYHYDADAIKEPSTELGITNRGFGGSKYGDSEDPKHRTKSGNVYTASGTRNKRSVWKVATQPYKGAHYATFPPKLIEPCVLAGCSRGGTVLDPFAGTGTTAQVARQCGCQFVGCELNEDDFRLISSRLRQKVLF